MPNLLHRGTAVNPALVEFAGGGLPERPNFKVIWDRIYNDDIFEIGLESREQFQKVADSCLRCLVHGAVAVIP